MTIQQALERAKEMRRVREGGGSAARPESAAEQSSPVTVRPEPAQPLPGPEVPQVALERMEFDPATCERYNVLVSDHQLSEVGRAAASYRLMRSRVLHRLKANRWSCIGITSAGPGEGKTITTLNLAISIAREKQRTVYLLDLDMRNPSVLERGGMRPTRSLSQYFSDGLEPHEVLFETNVPNLVVAGCVEPVPSASELLASPRLDELLNYIRRRSHGALIIIDLPPVLSTDEALVVAPRVDAMYLVVAEGVTRRDGLARAADLLSDFTVAGIIMNRSSESLGSDYYGY
jgi:capsular exopolysaccharide synthesis family protein